MNNSEQREYKLKEMTISLTADNIVESIFNENVKELTMEGVEESMNALRALNKINSKPKGGLTEMPSFYVNKKIVQQYTTTNVLMPVALGIVAESFAARLMGNLFLTLRERFWSSKEDYPVKVFKEREEALEWVRGYVRKASRGE